MGTATEKRAARGLLGATFDQWRDDAFSGGRELARVDRLSASDELTELWPALVCEMLRAGELVARWSEITRCTEAVPGSADEVGGAA